MRRADKEHIKQGLSREVILTLPCLHNERHTIRVDKHGKLALCNHNMDTYKKKVFALELAGKLKTSVFLSRNLRPLGLLPCETFLLLWQRMLTRTMGRTVNISATNTNKLLDSTDWRRGFTLQLFTSRDFTDFEFLCRRRVGALPLPMQTDEDLTRELHQKHSFDSLFLWHCLWHIPIPKGALSRGLYGIVWHPPFGETTKPRKKSAEKCVDPRSQYYGEIQPSIFDLLSLREQTLPSGRRKEICQTILENKKVTEKGIQ